MNALVARSTSQWRRARATRPSGTLTTHWHSQPTQARSCTCPMRSTSWPAAAMDNHRHAARLFGAAAAIRAAMGTVRWPVSPIGYDAAVTNTREALGKKDFDAAWAEGAGLSIDEAIAYARRGRGERKRPASGWESTDPDREQRRQACSRGIRQQGHRRTAVHLTAHRADAPHACLRQTGLESRIQLVQEAARHA